MYLPFLESLELSLEQGDNSVQLMDTNSLITRNIPMSLAYEALSYAPPDLLLYMSRPIPPILQSQGNRPSMIDGQYLVSDNDDYTSRMILFLASTI